MKWILFLRNKEIRRQVWRLRTIKKNFHLSRSKNNRILSDSLPILELSASPEIKTKWNVDTITSSTFISNHKCPQMGLSKWTVDPYFSQIVSYESPLSIDTECIFTPPQSAVCLCVHFWNMTRVTHHKAATANSSSSSSEDDDYNRCAKISNWPIAYRSRSSDTFINNKGVGTWEERAISWWYWPQIFTCLRSKFIKQ